MATSAHNIEKLHSHIPIGNEGEINANSIEFDVSAWDTLYPAGKYSITYTRYGETTVWPELTSSVSVAEGVLTWTPSEAVLAIGGIGTAVIRCIEDGVLKKSVMFKIHVLEGHGPEGEAPEPIESWISETNELIGSIEDAEEARVQAEEDREDAEDARAVWEEYNPLTEYLVGNKVSYDGSSYICIQESLGNLPTEETYWLLIARRGYTYVPTFELEDGSLMVTIDAI